jgi:RNA recognition motif-containing protein
MGNRLYVGNLSFQSNTESVREAFAGFGEVTDVHLVITAPPDSRVGSAS